MKRRDLLKGLTALSGGALCTTRSIIAQDPVGGASVLQAVPIRGLVSKKGSLRQPIQISVCQFAANGIAVTKIDGVEVDRRPLTEDQRTFQVLTAPADRRKDVSVSVIIDGRPATTVVTLMPVRKATIYILPHSHHDLGCTDIQPHIEEKQMNNIALAIDLARETEDYPTGAQLVWNEEVLWGVDLYMRRKSQAERDELLKAVKHGRISLKVPM